MKNRIRTVSRCAAAAATALCVFAADAGPMYRIESAVTLPGCDQPNGVAFDAATHRVFVACRGREPVLAVTNAENGNVVSTVPIGRGSDVLVFEAEQRKIYTANGVDANLTVIDQINADTYKISEAPTTRPYARTMALHPRTKTGYLVAAEGTVDPGKKWGSDVATYYPNTYFKDTFTVLGLERR